MKNKYFVLSKKVNVNMYNKYKKILTDVIFISDTYPDILNDDIIYYPNNQNLINLGYCNMHSHIKITSWDKVFYFFKNITLKDNTYYWIIEDDVFINKNKFDDFIYTLNNFNYDLLSFGWINKFHDKWAWYDKYKTIVYDNFLEKNRMISINQIIRMSKNMINEIINFKNKINKFLFHEILIYSICKQSNLTHKQIKNDEIFITALEKNSIFNKKKIKNVQKKIEFANKDSILIHPFKYWYNI